MVPVSAVVMMVFVAMVMSPIIRAVPFHSEWGVATVGEGSGPVEHDPKSAECDAAETGDHLTT
jgi:hypothetical protein